MAEAAEPFDPVIGTDAAVADTAEWQIVLCEMHQRAVDRHIARGGAIQHLPLCRLVMAKVVKRQRTGARIDEFHGFGQGCIGENRQDRTEYLLLRDLHLIGHARHDHGLHRAGGACRSGMPHLTHRRALGGGVIQQAGQPRQMPVVEYPRIIPAGRAIRIGFFDSFVIAGQEGVQIILVDQRVIRCDAGLACIDQFAKHDPCAGVIGSVAFFHDHRRFATQFQRHRHQIAAGRFHHLLADCRAAREEQMIEGQGREGCTDLGTACDNSNLFGWKQRAKHVFQHCIEGGREFRGFQHHAVACRNGRGQRHQRKDQRIVPRRHHPHHTQRLVFDARCALLHLERDMALLRPHHAGEVLV